jgi:hypothetical protein
MDHSMHIVFATVFAREIELRELARMEITETHEDMAFAHAEKVATRFASAARRANERAHQEIDERARGAEGHSDAAGQ